MAEIRDIELIAVASASADRAKAVAESYGVALADSFETLISRADIDAIAVTTPSGLHAEMAIAAMEAGKDVLIEKPLAVTLEDADRVISVANRLERLVAVVSQRRFEPAVEDLRATVAAGALGPMCLISGSSVNYRDQSYYDRAAWRGTRVMDGGVLKNQAIHEIDLVCWIGGPVESVAAHTATLSHQMEAEDTATVSLQFSSGALGQITATTCATPGFEPEIAVFGERGHIRLVGNRLAEWDVPNIPKPEAMASADGHESQYRDFVEARRLNRPPKVTARDARTALAVVEAAYRSSATGVAAKP